jgi:DNA-binding transcriptional regulator YhcF (GntR family)
VDLNIDQNSALPPYEQLRRRIVELVQAGELAAGTKLPTVRALAEQLGLAANTVARSYRELEAEGIIETMGRNGSVVRSSGNAIHRELQQAAVAYAERARRLGVDPDDAMRLVSAALSR